MNVAKNGLSVLLIGIAAGSACAATELQWTGAAKNGYIDDKDNWGGVRSPVYDSANPSYYGNFKSLTGATIDIGVSGNVRLDSLYFQLSQNATFNFDFTGHTVSFQGSGLHPFSTHTTCRGNVYNFLGGTFVFDGSRKQLFFSSPSTVTIGPGAVFDGSPEFIFNHTANEASVFRIKSGYQGRASVAANDLTHLIVEGVDRSTCITNQAESAWTLSGDVDIGSVRLGNYGFWTGYDSFGHRQFVSNAIVDVKGSLGHGYSQTASNHVLRVFGGAKMLLRAPSGTQKYTYAAGYLGCSNAVEISGATTELSLPGTDISLAGLACGVMGDRNFLHITDQALVDIGRAALMIGNPRSMMDRGRSVGNRILVDGGARVVCGPVWVGCAANRNDCNYNGKNSHTYNRDADGLPTTDVDMTIAASSNVVVFSGHSTTGVVSYVYVSANDDYRLPTVTDANGVEVRDGAEVIVSGNVVLGLRGSGNYLTLANGGWIETDEIQFGSNSILNFELTDSMSKSAMIGTHTTNYDLTVKGAPRIVLDTTGLTANREQTLLAARTGRRVKLDAGALVEMNASLRIKGKGTATLRLKDNDSRLVAKIGGLSGMMLIVR